MPSDSHVFTIGVEEEYLIVDPVTRAFHPDALALLAKARPTLGGQVQPEMQLSQLEIGTSILSTYWEDGRGGRLSLCRNGAGETMTDGDAIPTQADRSTP